MRGVNVNQEVVLSALVEDKQSDIKADGARHDAAPSESEKSVLSGVNKMARLGIG